MTIYYLIYWVLFFLSTIERKLENNKRIKKLVFLGLAVFLAVRFQVGNDYAEYYNTLIKISRGDGVNTYFEPGLIFLYKLIDSPKLFFALLSCFSIFLLYKTLNYFKSNHIYTVLLLYYSVYFIIFNIHLIRQGVAISIIFFSFTYLHKRAYIKCLLLVLLAANFHKSALIVLFFIPVVLLNLNKYHRILILVAAFFIFIVFTFFKEYVFLGLYILPITRRFAMVYNNLTYSGSYGISIGLIFDFLLFLFINFKKNISREDKLLLNIFMCSLFIAISFNSYAIAFRLIYYFRVVNIFLFLYLMRVKPKFVFRVFLLIFTYYYLNNNLLKGNAVLEYKTIFN